MDVVRIAKANNLFTPRIPISEASLLSGRTNQITKVISAVTQRGLMPLYMASAAWEKRPSPTALWTSANSSSLLLARA